MLPFPVAVTVCRWRFGWLTVRFADGVVGVFSSWEAAVFSLEHERLRIRA